MYITIQYGALSTCQFLIFCASSVVRSNLNTIDVFCWDLNMNTLSLNSAEMKNTVRLGLDFAIMIVGRRHTARLGTDLHTSRTGYDSQRDHDRILSV